MNRKIVWEARTSAFLYIYEYLFLISVGIGLYDFYPQWAVVPFLALVGFAADAKSMKHQLTEENLRLSANLFDMKSNTVKLEDVIGLQVIDLPPWNWISLGTVIVITDMNAELQPCIKSVRNPQAVANLIKDLAIKRGAKIEWWGA